MRRNVIEFARAGTSTVHRRTDAQTSIRTHARARAKTRAFVCLLFCSCVLHPHCVAMIGYGERAVDSDSSNSIVDQAGSGVVEFRLGLGGKIVEYVQGVWIFGKSLFRRGSDQSMLEVLLHTCRCPDSRARASSFH